MHFLISALIIIISFVIGTTVLSWYHNHIRNNTDKLWHHALAGGVFGATIGMIQYALGY